MRILFIVAWLFAGLGGAIYHYGPGQDNLEMDRVAAMLDQAHQNVRDENWPDAVELFDQVLADLPDEKRSEARQIQLEKCKAQMMAAELPEARKALEELLKDARADQNAAPEFVADVESTLANSQYYMTWLMRLEGMSEAEWLPEIEAARQHYTQITIDATDRGDAEMVARASEDLESAIRLARMDIGELQGLPLPSQ